MISFKTKLKVFAALVASVAMVAFASENGSTEKKGPLLEIPESTTSLGYGEFRNRKDIYLVVIPFSVTSIDKNAFFNCPNLLSISFDDDENWYVTQDRTNWENKTMGTRVDVSDASTNASTFRSGKYYFYKVEKD